MGSEMCIRDSRKYRPRGTFPQCLAICRRFECVGPVPPSAGIVCTDPARRLFQPVLECVGPVPPLACVLCTNPVGRSFNFDCCRCSKRVGPMPPSACVVCTDPTGRWCNRFLSAWGLYPLQRESPAGKSRKPLIYPPFIPFHEKEKKTPLVFLVKP